MATASKAPAHHFVLILQRAESCTGRAPWGTRSAHTWPSHCRLLLRALASPSPPPGTVRNALCLSIPRPAPIQGPPLSAQRCPMWRRMDGMSPPSEFSKRPLLRTETNPEIQATIKHKLGQLQKDGCWRNNYHFSNAMLVFSLYYCIYFLKGCGGGGAAILPILQMWKLSGRLALGPAQDLTDSVPGAPSLAQLIEEHQWLSPSTPPCPACVHSWRHTNGSPLMVAPEPKGWGERPVSGVSRESCCLL